MKSKVLLLLIIITTLYGKWIQPEFIIGTCGDPRVFFPSDLTNITSVEYMAAVANTKARYRVAKDAYFNMLTTQQYEIDPVIDGGLGGCYDFEKMKYIMNIAAQEKMYNIVKYGNIFKHAANPQNLSNDLPNSDYVKTTLDKFSDVFTDQNINSYTIGFFIGNEPYMSSHENEYNIKDAQPWVEAINTRFTNKATYLNCFPYKNSDYNEAFWNNADDEKNPSILCFNLYPIQRKNSNYIDEDNVSSNNYNDDDYMWQYSGKSMFLQLQTTRDYAYSNADNIKPFWQKIQATGHFNISKPAYYADPNFQEQMFLSFSPIIYGAKGIIYYKYQRYSECVDLGWTNYQVDRWNYSKSLTDYNTGAIYQANYDNVKQINWFIKNVLAPVVMKSKHLVTYHTVQDGTIDKPYNEDSPDGVYYPLVYCTDDVQSVKQKVVVLDKNILENNPNSFLNSMEASNDDKKFLMTGIFQDEENPLIYYYMVMNKNFKRAINNISIGIYGNVIGNCALSPSCNVYNGETDYSVLSGCSFSSATQATNINIGSLAGGEARIVKVTRHVNDIVVNGELNNSMWSGTVYIVGDCKLPMSKTLIINPGTKIVFVGSNSILKIEGKITASGSVNSKIILAGASGRKAIVLSGNGINASMLNNFDATDGSLIEVQNTNGLIQNLEIKK